MTLLYEAKFGRNCVKVSKERELLYNNSPTNFLEIIFLLRLLFLALTHRLYNPILRLYTYLVIE